MRFLSTLCLVLSLLQSAEPVQGQLRTEFVAPQSTDPAIFDWLEPHFVAIDKSVASRGELYVHLSGTSDVPENSQLLCTLAAQLGYYVVCLRYPNAPSVDALAAQSADPNVHEQVRRERLYGENSSPLLDVDRANSVENRLVKLLQYLAAAYPSESWEQFLVGDSPAWNRLALGGHSQGSGHAALLAKDHLVSRVLMFAGPSDSLNSLAAPWVSQTGATPLGRWFEFEHAQDFLGPQTDLALAALGFESRWMPVSVDDDTILSSGDHWLTTNSPVGSDALAGIRAHNSVVVDGQTPLDQSGAPAFAGVWGHMLSSQVTAVGDANDDGTVNLNDFGVFKANFGAPGGWLQGDFDGDRMVGLSDFGLLKAGFGGDQFAVVAEPDGLTLLSLGLLFVGGFALILR